VYIAHEVMGSNLLLTQVMGSGRLLTHLWKSWRLTAECPGDLTSLFQLVLPEDLDKSLRTGKNHPIRSKREDSTMELPRVNPVGLTEIPPGFQSRRRRYSLTARVMATVVLAVFALVVTVTTVVSLGSYCLTSDGSNTSGLPQSYLNP
jgi:hypothetical protein